jgi:hypothetical protein
MDWRIVGAFVLGAALLLGVPILVQRCFWWVFKPIDWVVDRLSDQPPRGGKPRRP